MAYGSVEHQNEANHKKKQFAVIGVSSVLLVAMVAAVAVGVSQDGESPKEEAVSTSQRTVKSLCRSTDFENTCEKSLEPSAKNSSDPKELIRGGFSYAMEELHIIIKNSSVLQKAAKDPRTRGAYDICRELMHHAIDEFTVSYRQLGSFDISRLPEYVADLKTWLTAAMAHQGACLDAFQNTTGNAGANMKKLLNTSREITSNALAMVTKFSSLYVDLMTNVDDNATTSSGGRKLLSPSTGNDGFPSWINEGKRRLLAATPATVRPDVIVAKDGSGKAKTIAQALKLVPKKNRKTFVIYIKAGVYKESVIVDKKMSNVMFIGDGQTRTKITGNKNFIDGINTYRTATVAVMGPNFIAKNIGFENTAGAIKHQAVALKVQADMAIFHNCQMDGYQDTLYTHSHRQFYRDCTISGTIDFVFGDAQAVLQNCKLVVRKPLDNQQCIVTAQGRRDRQEGSALVLQNCTITGDPAYLPFKKKNRAYLGRPWKPYSRTIIMNSHIDDLIAPEGWLPWAGNIGTTTCFFSEFNNRGPGASQIHRVKWKGIYKITAATAQRFTSGAFLDADRWIPPTKVPYTTGMIRA